MNTLNNKSYLSYIGNLNTIICSDALGYEYEGDGKILESDDNYLLNPIDVQEVERMCIDFGLKYELIQLWGIRIWRP